MSVPSDRGERRLRRMRWRCRRGTKELDRLLGRFVDAHAEAIREGAHPDMERLLDQEDDLLWNWLLGRQPPQDEALRRLVDRIRAHHTD